MFNKVILTIAIITVKQSIAARKCDLKSIFLTPEEIAKRDYDQFQILERSSFGQDEQTQQQTNPAAPNNDRMSDSRDGANSDPRSYANAQVLLRIGHEDLSRIQNMNDLSAKCLHHQYPPNFYYPPPMHPCFYNQFVPPSAPYVFPNYLYMPNFWPTNFQQNLDNYPEECVYKLPEKPKFIEPVNQPTIYRIVEATSSDKHENDMKLANTLEDQYITRIERKNHPKILKPLDLSEEKIKHDASKLSVSKSVNQNCETKLEKEKENQKIPTVMNEKSGKLLVTYPVHENKNKPICKTCERDPSIAFGKRFPIDEDDLVSIQKTPVTQSNILRNILPEIIFNILKNHLMISPGPDLSMPSPGTVPNQEQKTYFSGYQTSSGSSSYSDPYKIISYQEPTRMDFVESATNNLVPTSYEHIRKIETPSIYRIVPKYDIIPKYDVLPVSDSELPGKLWSKMLQMSQTAAGLGETRSYCPTCAKYYRELNE